MNYDGKCVWRRVKGHWHMSCRDDVAIRLVTPYDVHCPFCGRRIKIKSRRAKSDQLCVGCMKRLANYETGMCSECEVIYG